MMRATGPDCLARAQAESEAPPDPAALREADALWIAKANRAVVLFVRALICAAALLVMWVWHGEIKRADYDARAAAARATAKALATVAKHRTHAPEMAPMEAP